MSSGLEKLLSSMRINHSSHLFSLRWVAWDHYYLALLGFLYALLKSLAVACIETSTIDEIFARIMFACHQFQPFSLIFSFHPSPGFHLFQLVFGSALQST